MSFWQSLDGMMQLELTSADIARSLRDISAQGIPLESVIYRGDLTAAFRVSRKHYAALERWAVQRGDSLKILKREGLFWIFSQLRHRSVLVCGLALLLFLTAFLPSRICFITVEGNQRIPTQKILEAAGESGIYFGVSRRQIRSEKTKNQLLASLPELQWAGVNTYGCVAVISVRERPASEERDEQKRISSIVASRDGILLSCTATRGNLLCAPGQAVRQGDVLISAFTDCGLTITATRAEGEVQAMTQRELTAAAPSVCQILRSSSRKTVKYSLIIGKKRINFYKGSGIWDATCGKMYTQYYLTLPGGFRLPVSLLREVRIDYQLSQQQLPEEEVQAQLTDFAARYLRSIMVAGTVSQGDLAFEPQDGCLRMAGKFSCIEMIGSVRDEKIGDYNGKTDGTDR